MTFEELLKKTRKNYTPPERLLCLDPGFTTGVALFTNGTLTSWEQVRTIETETEKINWMNLQDLFNRMKPTHIICEDYRIYAHKLDQHTFSSVTTLRLIGGIELLSLLDHVPIDYQMAMQAKGFCTDDKLKTWGYWQPGMKHSRDAIRHGCYFMLFNKKEVR
jgi:hypothetical protein